MARKDRLSGNEAVAYAIKQVNPDVMPAFPITPSTEIPQMVSTYIANGQMDTEFIPVESEHSSMSATIGAMKNKLSFISIFTLCIALSLTACGGKQSSNTDSKNTQTEAGT